MEAHGCGSASLCSTSILSDGESPDTSKKLEPEAIHQYAPPVQCTGAPDDNCWASGINHRVFATICWAGSRPQPIHTAIHPAVRLLGYRKHPLPGTCLPPATYPGPPTCPHACTQTHAPTHIGHFGAFVRPSAVACRFQALATVIHKGSFKFAARLMDFPLRLMSALQGQT